MFAYAPFSWAIHYRVSECVLYQYLSNSGFGDVIGQSIHIVASQKTKCMMKKTWCNIQPYKHRH